MPLQIIGQDAFGVTVRKDDGSTVTIPHGIAQQMFADNSGFMGDPGAHGGPTFPMKGGYTVQPFQMSDGTMGDVNPAEVDQKRIAPDGSTMPPTVPQQLPPAPDAGVPAQDAPINDGGQPAQPAPPPAQAPPAPALGPPPSDMQPDAVSQPTGQTPGARQQVSQPPPAPRVAKGGGGGGGGMPNVEQMLLQNGNAAADAATQAGDIKAQQIERAAPLLLQAQRQYMAATAQNEAEFKTRMGQADAKSKALQAEVQRISQTRVNDNEVFDNMSTGGKIATFAALAMGGFVGAKSGTNMAADQIKNMVDNNIKVQLANLQNRREGVSQQNTLIQQDVARGMDLYTAATKAQALGYEQAAKIVDLEGSKLSGQLEKANAAQIAAKLRHETLQTFATYRASAMSTAAQNYATSSANMREKMQLAATTAVQIAGQQVGYSEHIMDVGAKKEAAQAKAAEEQNKLTVIGTRSMPGGQSVQVPVGVAKDEASHKEATKLGALTADAQKSLQEFEQSMNKYRGAYGGPGATQGYQIMQQKWANARVAMFELKFQRAPTDNDLELLDAQLPPPQGLLNQADPFARIQEAQQSIIDTYNTRMPNYVVNPRLLPPIDRGRAATPPAKPSVANPPFAGGGRPPWITPDQWAHMGGL